MSNPIPANSDHPVQGSTVRIASADITTGSYSATIIPVKTNGNQERPGLSDRKRGGSRDDPLDDIDFEEFDLTEPDNWDDVEQYRPYESSSTILTCPSCGVGQSAANRHCEQCGARLGQQRIAVAAPPLRSVSAGSRALGIIVVVIAIVVVAALIIPAIRGGDETPASDDPESVPSSSTTAATTLNTPIEEITPISITCSSEHNAKLRCENLIDGTEKYWNDQSLRGEDARITVTFVKPVALQQVQIINVGNEEKFRRNYRVRGVEIYADDAPDIPISGNIDNTNEGPHAVRIVTNYTLELEIRVTSTWPSEALGGEQAFDELAIEELKFWGRVQDTRPLENDSTSG